MQNTNFLFRDGASICQVNQQQALRDRKEGGLWKMEPFSPISLVSNKQTDLTILHIFGTALQAAAAQSWGIRVQCE